MPTYDGATPTKPDDGTYTYSFIGWTPDVTVASMERTYTATYSSKKITYTIEFDLNGGTSASYIGSRIVEVFSEDIFFFDCVKDGVNFRGWSYNGTKIFDEKGNQLANPKMASTMTFVAQYANTAKMTITTNMPGAGTITGEAEYPYNTYVDVAAHPIVGYKFVGWYYQGTLLSNTEDYKYMMWDKDVTLEARFKLDTFALNIESNNSTYGLVLVKSNYYNDYKTSYRVNIDYTTQTTIAAYSKTDVRFLGWYDDDNKLVSTNAIYTFTMLNHDYNLEAKWNYFTITYNLNGGEQNANNPISYTIDDNVLPLAAPTKTGYTFLGWKYNGDFVTSINPNWIDNITLDAIWEATTYSITYNLNGGTNSSSNPSTYNIESSTITFQAPPSRTGYTFDGWYSDSSFSKKVTSIAQGSYGDVNLYAKWTAIVYSITYNLDGGTNASSNPKTYTVEDAITLSDPSKTGYAFQGWYDGSTKVDEISKGTTGNITLNATWNEGNEYVVTLDPNEGTVSSTTVNVQYDHSYSLPTPTRTGYTFNGWYNGSSKISNSGTWKYASSLTLKASWSIISYSITYNLDGGTNASSNPKTYTVEDTITLSAPSKTGYTFDGWYSDSTKVDGISKGNTGNISITAKWSANKNNLSVTSEDEAKGTVAITSGTGYSDESITVVATPIDDWAFKGWYNGTTKVSYDAVYTFTMPTSDYSLVARFFTKAEAAEEERIKKLGIIPAIDAAKGTLTYGLYPQTHINDAATITALDALTTAESNGWYLYNGEYYAKKTAYPYSSSYTFNDGTTIESGTLYWFKCEPIKWKILTSSYGTYSLVSTVLLDTTWYDDHSNNYEISEIRKWLNDYFLKTAFSLDSSLIQTTTVDNSASTTNSSSYSYACANTEDKIYLLSYQDYINADYGFSTSTGSTWTRTCKPTDYALTKYLKMYNGKGSYWTRSPTRGYSDRAWYVRTDGGLDLNYVYYDGYFNDYGTRVDFNLYGVRPALTIKL